MADFETYLERAIDRLDDGSPNRALIREHFALDVPDAKRGKRLRPRILIAVAQTEGTPAERAFAAAAALELLHNFSLVHDDIEDRDELRHGRPTLWSRYGVPAALEAGNALCALSYLTLMEGSAELPPATVAAMAAALYHAHYRMCQGQAYDIGFETSATVSFAEYVRMIEGKTAALFGAACELGALAAGATGDRAAAYGCVGRAYGLAFQVRDDILGAFGATQVTGKPSGADIRRRKWSFPVTWALSGPPSDDRAVVADAYASIGELSDGCAVGVIAALERLGAQIAADDACAAYIRDANETSAAHDLDRDGRLAAIFEATARRTA
ncbi:polyprenyl synthetase [Vulcanimicrobium alpinum]|uniref:Polyprenyl synthetase n=1 Tax=Vulcanimicrobium alpinum TaxID=3016050 RepID=A0AAN2CAR8_UNVUL|nr:polyprenyl synthetase family protein [Vulcanimicrobium alpinum]BDE07243.1 polyprenyl synthetase [Vulcanimicrobium alpinum]